MVVYAGLYCFKADISALRRILGSISQQIDQYLAETKLICQEPGILQDNVLCIFLLFFPEPGFNQIMNTQKLLFQIHFGRLKLHFTAFNLRHIQNIIYQSQQILGRVSDLFQTFHSSLLCLILLKGNGCHTHNPIHRCTNLMRHPGQEV